MSEEPVVKGERVSAFYLGMLGVVELFETEEHNTSFGKTILYGVTVDGLKVIVYNGIPEAHIVSDNVIYVSLPYFRDCMLKLKDLHKKNAKDAYARKH